MDTGPHDTDPRCGDDRVPASVDADPDRIARALLSHLAVATDPLLVALRHSTTPLQILKGVRSATLRGYTSERLGAIRPEVWSIVNRWRDHLAHLPDDGGIASARQAGIRLICPGDPEWPAAVDELGDTRPYALWVRGAGNLSVCCQRAVTVVGARAATAYGGLIASEIAAGVAVAGLTVVSGAAYGIDAVAHQAALSVEGCTVAVLACGLDIAYPRAHAGLLEQIAAHGVIVSEYPPGRRPSREAFLARNRIAAALSNGTVVVESGRRGGALSTTRHARHLGRPVMAVPGPVTSEASAGCHALIREQEALCVTSTADVLAGLGI
jgi:DNA processing protein